jgi:putative spermidine/putrescine transport system substrate-binding protein
VPKLAGLRQRWSRRAFLARALTTSGGLLVGGLLTACQPESSTPARERPTPNQPPTNAAAEPTDLRPTSAPTAPASGPDRLRPFSGQTIGMMVGSGPMAQLIRERIQPEFEQAHGVQLTVEEGGVAEQLARLRGPAANPPYLVMSLEEQAVSLARQEGLISRLDSKDVPNLANVYPEYLLEEGYGVGQAASWVTVWYNSQRVKKDPGTSAAFWDPKFQARVAVPVIQSPAGLQWLVTSAALASGKSPVEAQYDVEPGFEKWRQLKPNLHSTYTSFYEVAALLAQGEIWLAFGHSRQANAFIVKGAPIERSVVAERPFLGLTTLVLAKHPPLEPLGKDLINRLLSPEAQAELPGKVGMAPVTGTSPVPPELVRLLPVGVDEAKKMIRLDWGHANAHRAAWVERWSAEIGS